MAGAAFDALQERILLLAWHGCDPAAGRDGGPIAGRDWLQFEMYPMCGSYGDPEREAGYAPGPMGPYSAAVDGSLERLLRAGLLAEVAGGIFVTVRGEAAAAGLESGRDRETMTRAEESKEFTNRLTRDELLCYASRAHPGLALDSPERGRVEAAADGIIMGMAWKGRIGLSMAGGPDGKDVEDMMRGLKRRGYRLYT